MLMPQDVEVFSKYGFSDLILRLFGAIQLIGGILLPFRKTRIFAAAIIAITFFVSLFVLILEGNLPVSIATAVATLLLVLVMRRSKKDSALSFQKPSDLLSRSLRDRPHVSSVIQRKFFTAACLYSLRLQAGVSPRHCLALADEQAASQTPVKIFSITWNKSRYMGVIR